MKYVVSASNLTNRRIDKASAILPHSIAYTQGDFLGRAISWRRLSLFLVHNTSGNPTVVVAVSFKHGILVDVAKIESSI
jgi:hypothetical protein